MMRQTVDQGARQGVVVKDLPPVLERSVGGQNDRSLFITFGDDLKEKIGSLLVKGQKAHFVDDQEFGSDKSFELFLQRVIGQGSVKAVDEIGRGDKESLGSPLTGGIGNREGQMGFANPRGSHKNDVFFLIRKFPLGQF